jgi:hypothetical protein
MSDAPPACSIAKLGNVYVQYCHGTALPTAESTVVATLLELQSRHRRGLYVLLIFLSPLREAFIFRLGCLFTREDPKFSCFISSCASYLARCRQAIEGYLVQQLKYPAGNSRGGFLARSPGSLVPTDKITTTSPRANGRGRHERTAPNSLLRDTTEHTESNMRCLQLRCAFCTHSKLLYFARLISP